MRRDALALLVLLLALTVVPAAARADIPELAAAWHLDSVTATTPDSSGHNLTGTVVGAPLAVSPARFGDGLRFPTEGDYVNAGDHPELQPATISVLAWVRSDTVPTQVKAIVSQGAQGNCAYSSYSLYTGGSLDAAGLRFYVHVGAGVVKVTPPADNAIWNGQWHLVAGTYDGAAVRLFVDGQEVGSGTPASGPIGYGLNVNNDFIIGGAKAPACIEQTNFTGDLDEVRVYNRALTGDEIAYLARSDHTTPPELPIPAGTPPPPPPPEPPPPEPVVPPPSITGVEQLAPPAIGKIKPSAVIFAPQFAGTVTKLLWNVFGDSRPDLITTPDQNAIRFRPSKATLGATVQAVGPGGESSVVRLGAVSLSALSNPVAKTVIKHLGRAKPTVVAAPLRGLISVTRDSPKLDCSVLHTTMVSGALEMRGCMRPITSLDDIPPPERGVLANIAQGLGIPLERLAMNQAMGVVQSYIATDNVSINGVKFTVGQGAAVVVAPELNVIASSNASMSVGGLQLANPTSFVLRTTQSGGFDLGTFDIKPNSTLKALGSFPFVGPVKVEISPSAQGLPTGARITANLKLPSFLQVGGVEAQGRVVLNATAERGLILDSARIGPINAQIGPLSVQQFQIDYTPGPPAQWRGQGKACVPGGACLDMIPPNGGVRITGGSLEFAGATLFFPKPGITLFPGLQMESIGFGIGLDPTRFTGNTRLVAVGIYEIDGRLFLAFPSDRTPFVLDPNEEGPGFPASFYGQRFTRTTIGVAATASLRVPVVGSIRVGGAYLLYEYPGYIAFGGGIDQNFLGILSISGGVAGELNAGNGRFNISGRVSGCLIGVLCRGAFGLVSSRGAAVCLDVGPLSVGGGVVYSPFSVRIWPLDGCKWSPFAEVNVRGAQSGAQTVVIEKGDPGQVFQYEGTAEAPRVRVIGPDGQSLDSPAESGFVNKGALRIVRSEPAKITSVGLQDPPPGTYRIERLDGSPAIAEVKRAEDQPDAHVTARVLGRGSKRVLVYDVTRRDSQRVTFTEISGDSRKVIGTITGGGQGTLSFSPAPGRGVRTIEAQFELAGLPAEKIVVARFTPPGLRLGRPGRLQVIRAGTSLRLSWNRVAEATAYEVVATTNGSGQLMRRTAKRSMTLHGIAKASNGTVTVRAVDSLRRSSPARVSFRATGRRITRFSKLPRSPKL